MFRNSESDSDKKAFSSGSWFDRNFRRERIYRRNYYETLNYQHRNFDVKGLTTQGTFTLALQQVFVDLALVQQSRNARISSDPLRSVAARRGEQRRGEQRRELWSFLTASQLESRSLVILGPPGSGKTTLLKHITLSLASESRTPEATSLDRTPVLLFLRNHAPDIVENPNFRLIDAVQGRLAMWDVDVPTEWLVDELQNGRCLIMLDGLDEVADPQVRQQVVAWVERQIKQLGNNRFVITSRPFGYYHNPLSSVVLLEVRPFTIEQVNKFVHNWYIANEIMSSQNDDPGVRMEAQRGADDLLMRLGQVPVLLEMAVNPLLLTMIATVHRYRSSLPGRRVELYSEICEVFLGKRQQARGIAYDLTPAQKERVLQTLAYHMMQHKQREIAIDQAAQIIERPLQRVKGPHHGEEASSGKTFLKMIENSSGLLIEREAGVYSFAHLTFQEYLASVHIMSQSLENEMINWVDDSWWHETIRLYAAQADATNVIKACLGRKRPSIAALTLAMECLEEAREVRPELRTIFQKLADSVDHQSIEVRQIAAEVFLTLRVRRMVRVDEAKYVDTSLITNAEYQLFLLDNRLDGNYYQPDHWQGYDYGVGNGRKPVVGVRPSDVVAFCHWLTEREKSGWRYRPPQAQELSLTPLQNDPSVSDMKGITYWYQNGDGFSTADFQPAQSANEMLSPLSHQFEKDWDVHAAGRSVGSKQTVGRLLLSRVQKRQFIIKDLGKDLAAELRPFPKILEDYNLIRDRALPDITADLDKALSNAIGVVNDPDPSVARNLSLDEVLDQTATLRRDIDNAGDLEVPRGMVQEIMRDVEHARDLSRNREVVMFRELDRALNAALRHTRELGSIINRNYANAARRLRVHTLGAVVDLINQREQRRSSGITHAGQSSKQLLATLVDLYVDLMLLEARINGDMPAFEGLRVVRVKV